MTRIVSGRWGGRRLRTPGGSDTRPTSERVREALFSLLEHLGAVEGSAVLDLYAGSGALGLEALSRGAASLVAVERSRAAAAALLGNIADLEAGDVARVMTLPVERHVARPAAAAYDLVFADPPYDLPSSRLEVVVAALIEQGGTAPDATVVLERSTRSPAPQPPPGWGVHTRRDYGETAVWVLRPAEDDTHGAEGAPDEADEADDR